MKKFVVCMFLLINVFAFAQNKKKVLPKELIGVVLTKNEDLSVELFKSNLYLFRIDGKLKKDTLLLKNFTGTPTPVDCVIKKFKSKEVPLYLITWNEKAVVETTTKQEEVTNACSQIWNPATKLKVFDNEQKSTKIKEQVFLDKLKTASETQHRMRNEGYTFTLLPTGEFTLRNKAAESKYVLNPTLMKYEVPVKAAAQASPPVKKKKK